jgi:hypothetical protein
VGAGAGGVDEMKEKLNESTVQWGLLRFSIGAGTFKRNKMLMINFQGDSANGLARAKLNKHVGAATAAFGMVNATVTMGEKSEMTLDNILSETKARCAFFRSRMPLFPTPARLTTVTSTTFTSTTTTVTTTSGTTTTLTSTTDLACVCPMTIITGGHYRLPLPS